MLPGQHPSQFQPNATAPSAPLQMMGNPGSFMPNPMQIQPQMRIPNNYSNTQFPPGQLLAFQMNQMNNANYQQKGQFFGQNVATSPQFLNQNVGFGGMPNPMQNINQLLQMQMAMQMASYAQVVPGMYPNQMSQGMGMQNSNIAMNGHLGRPNGSGTGQQSMNGNLSKQMANANQKNQQSQGQSPLMNSFGIVQQPQTQNFNAHTSANSQGQLPLMNPFGFVQQPQTQNFNAPANTQQILSRGSIRNNLSTSQGGRGKVCQGMGPQISNFAMNAHLGLLNANGAVQQTPNVNQQLLGQLPLMNPFGFVQQPQTQNFNAVASTNTQANRGVGLNQSKGNQPNSYNSNFSRNQKHGDKKSKFDEGKFSNHNKSHEKGHHRNEEKKNILANSVKPEMENKRSLLVIYSAQEIRRWREDRRKNYPSKANIEKLTEKTVESEDSLCAAKLRRQQLKEILAKQAELGCEVAEIPPSYLSDSENQVDWRDQKRPLSRKERYQKRFNNKREKFNRNDRFSKKRRFGNSDASNTCDQKGFPTGKVDVDRVSATQVTKNAREPTLLQKLLSSDIRRDKRRLLQVFRFMTMNFFFKDCPEKPLRFPQVLLKETGEEIAAAEEIYDAINTTVEKSADDSDNDNGDEDNITEFTEAVSELQDDGNSESEEPQEDEE